MKDPQRGLTHLIAEDEGDKLTSLDVRGLLTHMSVSVGEEELADPQKGRSGWSRLDFAGTEIALGLPDDMVRARAAGASGVVTLGEAARQFAYDNRPLLIANFPPQHVAEQAYSRRARRTVAWRRW
jgi:hypothetical protein